MPPLPPPLIATVADALAHFCTHSELELLFMEHGISDPLPTGNKKFRALTGLKVLAEQEEPWPVLGQLITNLMEIEEDPFGLAIDGPSQLETSRKKISNVLAKYGLEYRIGGLIVPVGTPTVSPEQAQTNAGTPTSKPATQAVASLRAFISYSTEARIFARYLKDGLEFFGLAVFLAHEDLKPSQDWQDEIVQKLRGTDVFLPVFTPHFKISDWADQECGMAFAAGKLIVPIKAPVTPYGFLGRYQAMACNPAEPDDSLVPKIIDALANQKSVAGALVDSTINVLAASLSWVNAGRTAELLDGLADQVYFSEAQMRRIIQIEQENSQVGGSFRAAGPLQRLKKKVEDQAGRAA